MFTYICILKQSWKETLVVMCSKSKNSFVTYHFKKHGQTVQNWREKKCYIKTGNSDGSIMCDIRTQQI